jgi:hypothetical protein
MKRCEEVRMLKVVTGIGVGIAQSVGHGSIPGRARFVSSP